MNNQSFGSQCRLSEAADFKKVLAERSTHSALLRLKALPNGLAHARLGTVVAKRAVPTAVQRHRIKRLIREYFRCHRDPIVPLDLVIMASPPAGKASNTEIRQCLDQLWQKLIKRYAASSQG